MFASLKVRTIVAAGALSLAGMSIAGSLASSHAISIIGGHLDYMGGNTVPSVAALGEIATNVSQANETLAQHVLAATREETLVVDDALRAEIASVERNLNAYEPYVSDEKERALFRQVRKDWQSWKTQTGPVVAASLALRTEDARALLKRTVTPVANRLRADVDAETKYNMEIAADALARSQADKAAATWRGIALGFASVGVAIAIFLLFRARVTRPLSRLNGAMVEMAQGRLDMAIPGEQKSDELGEIARSLGGIRRSIEEKAAREAEAQLAVQRQIVTELGQGMTALKQGELTHRIETPFPADYETLRTDYNDAIGSLADLVREISDASQSVRAGATEISSAAGDLAKRTESQAASLEETAASVRELTSAVTSAEGTALRASQSATDANGEATGGGAVMGEAVAAMDAIAVSSDEMKSIVEIIDGIAFQTNLLALNAGVEAARAGDAGKGFAVVANEVRALSQRSADAAKDIGGLIRSSAGNVANGVQLVKQTRGSLDSIVDKTGEVAGLISELAVNAARQSVSIQQVNSVITEMDRITQQNAALVEESNAASVSLAGQADRLSSVVARFSIGRTNRRPSPETPAQQPVAVRPAPRAAFASNGNAALAHDEGEWAEF